MSGVILFCQPKPRSHILNISMGLFGDWELAMAAYNTGEGRVKRAIKLAKRKGQKQNYSSLRLPRETRNYVPAIMALSVIYKNYERYGLGHVTKNAADG